MNNDLDKEKLNRLINLTEENNKILLKMRSYQRWQTIMKIIYLIIFLAVTLGLFYYLEPTVSGLYNQFNNISSQITGFQNSASSTLNSVDINQITKILKAISN